LFINESLLLEIRLVLFKSLLGYFPYLCVSNNFISDLKLRYLHILQ